MFKTTLFLFLLTAPLLANANNQRNISYLELQQIENAALSCSQVDSDLFGSKTLKCLNNAHKLILKNLAISIYNLKDRDRVSTLNTKGLDYEILRSNCENSFEAPTLVKECQIHVDLSYLNYLHERFSK